MKQKHGLTPAAYAELVALCQFIPSPASSQVGLAIGPQQSRKVFTLQTITAWEDDDRFAQVAKVAGFSLHARVPGKAGQREQG